MTFDEILDQVRALLQQRGRVTYRSLKRRFDLEDEYVEDLKGELIRAEGVAVDEDGDVLVWTGGTAPAVTGPDVGKPSSPPVLPPVSYTPPHLIERIRAEQAVMEARGAPDGERKIITALFADLKGSTALIEGLDPEEARAIIDPALQLMMDAVHRYEGYVAQALGDGIFALFGAPIAHEDHPQRTLYAALRMQEDMHRYSDQVRLKYGVPLAMRVGINTGEVVVRSIRKDDLHTDYVPVGHSTNLAARMEQMATPGSILVTAYTYKLTEGYFAFKSLGQTQIKGVEEPLTVYEVLGAGPLRTRLQVTATRRGLTRFVGRQREMEQLHTALEHAKTGQGQIVGVMGEPGLGKSRLFYEFKLLSQTGCLLLEAYSVSHGKASPYLPVIELLKSYFRIELSDDERTRREKVGGKVLMLDRSLEDTLPYLFALLGIEEQPSPLQQMDPQIRRQRTFEALKKLLLRESLNQPLLLIFEDLHWIDSETQGFLDTLSEGVASAKILLLVNYRPEYRHEWGQKTYYTQLRLAPFGKGEAEEFLTFLFGLDVGLAALKQQILAKTEGTPFFMEEVVQTLVEDGTLTGERGHYLLSDAEATMQLPTTVQGVLAARIDRLEPDEKALLQQLAVIGREFPLSLIRQVITQPEDELHPLLSALQRKEFLYEHPAFPEVEYLFKHALTQEVAYHSVLIERRKMLHEHTGQAIEQLYHERVDEHYSDLAHHYQRSGNSEKAIEYLHKAGQQAVQRSAFPEAIRYTNIALDLLRTTPDSLVRSQRELQLQIALSVSIVLTQGFATPEVENAYIRSRDLCVQLGATHELASVLLALTRLYTVRGQLTVAYETAEHALAVASSCHDPALLLQGHFGVGACLLWYGELRGAQDHLQHSMALYRPQEHHALSLSFGEDIGVTSLSFLALAQWSLGYPELALNTVDRALMLARSLSHPFGLAVAHFHAAVIRRWRWELALAYEHVAELRRLSNEQGFSYWATAGEIYQCAQLVEQQQIAEGIIHIQRGLDAARALGSVLWRPFYLALLAEAYGKVGQAEDGLAALAEALAVIEKTDERFYEAEVLRLTGKLTLQQQRTEQRAESREQEVEGYFLKAIAIAQQQHAKSLELRAVMSLVRLRQQQALERGAGSSEQGAKSKESGVSSKEQATRTKLAEAHQLLSEVYNWFTEGFDTKDLQEAKALLEELT